MTGAATGTSRSGLVLSVAELNASVASQVRAMGLLGASRLHDVWRISDIRDGADCIVRPPASGERVGTVELLQDDGKRVAFELDWPPLEAQLIDTLDRIGEHRRQHPLKPRPGQGGGVSWMNHLIGGFGRRKPVETAPAASDKRAVISGYLSKFGRLDTGKPTVDLLLVGSPGSGKTTAITTVSTSKVHSTEVEATDTVATLKQRTTIALDYGECEVDGGLRVRLYGTPGQLRFAHMIRQKLSTCDAALILADATSLDPFEDVRHYAELLRGFASDRPVMVAYTHLDQGSMPRDLRARLSDLLDRRVASVPLDPRDRSSVVRSLSLLANSAAPGAGGTLVPPAVRSA